MIDDEASEIEVHRLVREFKSDDSLSDAWVMYQQVRTTMRSSAQESVPEMTPAHHRALFNRISEAIEAEDSHSQKPSAVSQSPARIVVGSLALAASLVVAVFIGIQNPEETGRVADGMTETPVNVQTVSTAVPTQALAEMPATAELVELDEEKQRRLRAYLNEHGQMSRMNTNQQLVKFKEPAGK